MDANRLFVVSMYSVALWKSCPLRSAIKKSWVVSVLPRTTPCWSPQDTRIVLSPCCSISETIRSAASFCSSLQSRCRSTKPTLPTLRSSSRGIVPPPVHSLTSRPDRTAAWIGSQQPHRSYAIQRPDIRSCCNAATSDGRQQVGEPGLQVVRPQLRRGGEVLAIWRPQRHGLAGLMSTCRMLRRARETSCRNASRVQPRISAPSLSVTRAHRRAGRRRAAVATGTHMSEPCPASDIEFGALPSPIRRRPPLPSGRDPLSAPGRAAPTCAATASSGRMRAAPASVVLGRGTARRVSRLLGRDRMAGSAATRHAGLGHLA
jgi:hypothetical protein